MDENGWNWNTNVNSLKQNIITDEMLEQLKKIMDIKSATTTSSTYAKCYEARLALKNEKLCAKCELRFNCFSERDSNDSKS
jgi:hypothetical protein